MSIGAAGTPRLRVLVVSTAQDAHFNGCVPLAWALQTAGHEVRVASHPALMPSIQAAGLSAVPVGRDHQIDTIMRRYGGQIFALNTNADVLENRLDGVGLDYYKGWDSVITGMVWSQLNNDSMIDDLVSYCQTWQPDLVVWETFTFAGAIAAEASGAAHARLLGFPDMFGNMRRVFRHKLGEQPAPHHDDMLREWLTWSAGRFGVPWSEELETGQWTIDQMPASIGVDLGLHTVPMQYVPYNGPYPAVVPDWLREPPQRPRVCLTLGVTIRKMEFPNAIDVGDVLEAMADLDVEVVATLAEAELAGVARLPDNVRVVDNVPMHALMPSCSAIVHHGGTGTWATAAVHGVPQVAMGWIWDALYRAQRLEDLGAGLALRSDELNAATLRDKLQRLLSEPSFAAGAAALGAEMRSAPSPNAVVPELVELTRLHRTRPALVA